MRVLTELVVEGGQVDGKTNQGTEKTKVTKGVEKRHAAAGPSFGLVLRALTRVLRKCGVPEGVCVIAERGDRLSREWQRQEEDCGGGNDQPRAMRVRL